MRAPINREQARRLLQQVLVARQDNLKARALIQTVRTQIRAFALKERLYIPNKPSK